MDHARSAPEAPRHLTQAERLRLLDTMAARGWLTGPQLLERRVGLTTHSAS